jgi:hypothetical protein
VELRIVIGYLEGLISRVISSFNDLRVLGLSHGVATRSVSSAWLAISLRSPGCRTGDELIWEHAADLLDVLEAKLHLRYGD